MATSSEDCIASDEMKELETNALENLNCSLCLKVFRNPRRLTCFHSFCHECLHSHISSTTSTHGAVKEFNCPTCGYIARSGDDMSTDRWVCLFPLNTILLSVLMKEKVKVELVCNVCQAEGVTSPADKLCIVCEEALCTGCSKVHRNHRLFQTHTILKTEELPNRQNFVLHNNSYFHCVKHTNIPLKLYCKNHVKHLCSECFFGDHKRCPDVVELTTEIPKLSETLSQIKEQLNDIEHQFKMLADINVSNLNKLASQVKDLTREIRDIKKSMNEILDELEEGIRLEGERICNEERRRIDSIKLNGKSQIMPIKNLNAILTSVEAFSTQAQKSILASNLMNQISLSKAKIQEYYSNNDVLTLHLEINPLLRSIFSLSRGDTARLKMKRNDRDIAICDGFKPLKQCRAELVKTVDVKHPDDQTPHYSDVTYVSRDQMVLVDCNNSRCFLLNSAINYVTSIVLPHIPSKVCVIKDNEIVVSLPNEKALQFLSIQDNTIVPTRKITTRHKCYGISSVSRDEMIVSGPCGDGRTYYWGLITTEAKQKSYHEFAGNGTVQTFVALNSHKTRLYISVWGDNALHCYGLNGMKYFTYKLQDLGNPQGVALDKDDNVYIAAGESNNIAQISPYGSFIQIIVKDLNMKPVGICFDRNSDTFVLTHYQNTTLSQYRLKDKDG